MCDSMQRRELLKKSALFSMGFLGAHEARAQNMDAEDPFPHMRIEFKDPERYSPLAWLEDVHEVRPPLLAFDARTREDALAWQKRARQKLWEILNETHNPRPETHGARMLEKPAEVNGYTREKWELTVVPGRAMPFHVLKPLKRPPVNRVAVCLHGHGNGVKDILGMPVDDEAAELIRTLNGDYAVQAVRHGWSVVAPELWSFGERLDFVEGARAGFDGGCEKPHLNAITLGKSSIGIRAKDIVTLVDWISAQKEFDMDSLACIGLSGGGMMTMYASALDERIRRVLISGYLTQMKGSILGVRHCGCNYVPGLALWLDFPDITGLIAPRRLIAQSGVRDMIFPIESFRAAGKQVRSIYDVFGTGDRFTAQEHRGFHMFYPPSLDDLLA